MYIYRQKKGRGQVLIITIVFFAIIAIISATLFTSVGGFIKSGSRSVLSEQATAFADSGVERALWQLNTTAGAFYGDTSEVSLGQSGTSFVTITDKSPSVKTIVATGYVGTSQNPRSVRTVKVDAYTDLTRIAFNYAVQVGTGGVTMSNSASINGTVYSNKTGAGSIQGFNSSTIFGDAWTVGTISTPDPLVTGTKNQNQQASQMPTVNYQQWKDDATSGEPFSNCTWTNSQIATIGARKCTGDFSVSNSAEVTITGPIYVVGNVSVTNSAKVKLDNSFGSNGTVFITDGTVSVSNSGGFVSTTANPKGYILVVTTSTSNNAVAIANQGVNAIFYALDGGAQLSNTAHVTSLVAKSLSMANSSNLTYDQGLANINFTSGPGASWQIKKGTYKFVANP